MTDKYIFTFWEPKENIPAYVKLCMQTWRMFLNEYRIVTLDYHNLNQWLDEETIEQILSKNMSLAIQADAIRVALLEKNGGIWMDADTIITSSEFLKYCNTKSLVMIGDKDAIDPHVAFMKAPKDLYLLKRWLKHIKARVKFFKSVQKLKPFKFLIKRKWKKAHAWDFLGNGIINPLLLRTNPENYQIIDEKEKCVFLEQIFYKLNKSDKISYRKFYFQENIDPHQILEENKGIIMLHNSWTPKIYKEMSEKEFLEQNNTLSNLLLFLLQKNKI